MKKRLFTGSGVAIVTPMDQEGKILFDRLERLVDEQVEAGTDAIIICGTTGESSTMSDEEHIECIARAVKAAAGRVPVIAGAGSNDTAYAVWMSKQAKQLGADGLLHVTPYYNKASQTGLVRHFNAIADATDLPVILYNVPSRTGLAIKPETYQQLAKHPNIVAVKEAGGNISEIARMVALCGDEMPFYSGNDDQIVPLMSLGALGVISVLANVCPAQTHQICQLFMEGKVQESLALQIRLLPLINALFADVNPIPVKEAMNLMGKAVGPCRLPLCEIEPAARQKLVQALREQQMI